MRESFSMRARQQAAGLDNKAGALAGGIAAQELMWIGYFREGFPHEGRSTRISQVYKSSRGDVFALQQWNLAAEGHSILAAKENMNVSV